MDNRFTSEELKKAEEMIAKLEERGFFLLCGCSMDQQDCSPEEPESEE